MKIIVFAIVVFWPLSLHARVLVDSSSFVDATVINHWHGLGSHRGADGPVTYMDLEIESLYNPVVPDGPPVGGSIEEVIVSPAAGFPGDGVTNVSVLRANVALTDYRFSFPVPLKKAGFYLRDVGTFDIHALDINNNILESERVILEWPNVLAFRGFDQLPGFRRIRVTELNDGSYVTDFAYFQWQAIPEPSAVLLAMAGGIAFHLLLFRSRRQRREKEYDQAVFHVKGPWRLPRLR
jgi:hypothetical protein